MVLRNSDYGLEDLVGEDLAEIVEAGDVPDRFLNIRNLYGQFLDLPAVGNGWNSYIIGRAWLNRNVADVLNPEEINLFLKITKNSEGHIRYNNSDDGRTGLFMTRLLQSAYDSEKHNDFVLDMDGLAPLHNVGYGLIGNLKRKWNIVIKGEVGKNCLRYAHMIGNVKIEKAGDYCLGHVRDIGDVKIGMAGHYCLLNARNIEQVNIETAGRHCLHNAINIGDVYTIDMILYDGINKTSQIVLNRNCFVCLVSSLDEV